MGSDSLKWQRKIIVIVLSAAAALLCILTIAGNLKKSAVLEGETRDIFPDSTVEAIDCGYDEKTGRVWQTGDDPQLHITGFDQEAGGVRIEILETSGQGREFQVFWSDNEAFGEKQFSDGFIAPGQTEGAVDIKRGNWSHLRIDMGGEFTIRSIQTAPSARVRYYLDQRGAGRTLKSCAVILLVMGLAGAAHGQRLKKNHRYLASLLGQGGSRNGVYDYLRILATVLVITGHVLQSDLGRVAEGGGKYTLMSLLFVFCASCNPVYVMLSGALLLPWKEESPGKFYLRRMTKVVLPMAVYFAVYLYLNRVTDGFSLSAVKLFLGRLISGYTPEAPHYWLIYTLLSLYVAAPFLRRMVKNMDYSRLTNLAAVIFVAMAAETYIPLILGRFAVSTFLASWTGALLLGYWLTRPETRRYDRILIAGGILGAAATAGLALFGGVYKESAVNCSFSMVLMIGGLFAFCLRCQSFFERRGKVLMFLCRYSYSIILIHWAVLFFFTKEKLHIYGDMAKVAGGTALAAAVTLAVSAFFAFLIDNTVVAAAELVFEMCARGVKHRPR